MPIKEYETLFEQLEKVSKADNCKPAKMLHVLTGLKANSQASIRIKSFWEESNDR